MVQGKPTSSPPRLLELTKRAVLRMGPRAGSLPIEAILAIGPLSAKMLTRQGAAGHFAGLRRELFASPSAATYT